MQSRQFVQIVALSALWGASFMFIRIAVPLMGSMVVAGLRAALASLTLVIIMAAMREPWPWRHWRELLLLGTTSVAAPFLLYSWAGLHLPSGYGALLNTTAVIFGMLAAAWTKEDTITPRKLLGCVCGFVGIALIVQLGPVQITTTTLAAALACVFGSFCYGVSTPLMKRATTRMQPLAIAAGLHLAAMLLLLPGSLWALPQARFTPGAVAAVVVMGMLTSGVAYWVHLRIIRVVSPVAAMSPIFLIPVFGVTWGHLFLGEALSSGIFLGGALVLLAAALVTGFNPLRRWWPGTPPL
ncbi:DMT family transporter [Hydrogenophaga sp. BPS33]|uniref:DMT family transporter n=1 Tax=Hydrogenophaga sp. BPS33 TaxID=2651974 RepID=UPI00131FEBC8|nr:DMT family transporter [Hydrogenophaga sp. BPS33]QHE86934.1 DMT family transporter [Hydrogenophaga sp. BPS33]